MEIKNFIKTFIIYTLVGILCTSCPLQKRLYNKGYYLSKNHSLKKTEEKTNTDTIPSLVSNIKPVKVKEVPVTLSAEIPSKTEETKHSSFIIHHSKLKIDACDTLFLRNGAKILVKVTEVYANQIA